MRDWKYALHWSASCLFLIFIRLTWKFICYRVSPQRLMISLVTPLCCNYYYVSFVLYTTEKSTRQLLSVASAFVYFSCALPTLCASLSIVQSSSSYWCVFRCCYFYYKIPDSRSKRSTVWHACLAIKKKKNIALNNNTTRAAQPTTCCSRFSPTMHARLFVLPFAVAFCCCHLLLLLFVISIRRFFLFFLFIIILFCAYNILFCFYWLALKTQYNNLLLNFIYLMGFWFEMISYISYLVYILLHKFKVLTTLLYPFYLPK